MKIATEVKAKVLCQCKSDLLQLIHPKQDINKAIDKIMQVRWNYKLQPNKRQSALMSEWLITPGKHRNHCLAERKRGFETNNQHNDQAVMVLLHIAKSIPV